MGEVGPEFEMVKEAKAIVDKDPSIFTPWQVQFINDVYDKLAAKKQTWLSDKQRLQVEKILEGHANNHDGF